MYGAKEYRRIYYGVHLPREVCFVFTSIPFLTLLFVTTRLVKDSRFPLSPEKIFNWAQYATNTD